jgi:hypothetical protein
MPRDAMIYRNLSYLVLGCLEDFFHCLVCSSLFASALLVYYNTVALRQVQNELRKKVNEFAVINTGLTLNINQLQSEASRLKETDEKLQKIAEKQGATVDKLKSVVKENQTIINEKMELIKADTMQAMMTVVLESDFDESHDFSDREINRLVLRMKNLPAIKVNEDLLRLKMNKHRSVLSVIDLLQDIENDDIPEEDHIFLINEAAE